MVNRRTVLKIGFASGWLTATGNTTENGLPTKPQSQNDATDDLAKTMQDNIYTRALNVQPHLAAHEHITRLGGNRVSHKVKETMAEANDYFVDMHQLFFAAGQKVARWMGAEDAIITAGGFSSMILASAACLTGKDTDRLEALPQVDWTPNECLIPFGHRFEYDRAYRCAGATIVEAKDRQDLEKAVNPATAMIAGLAMVEKQNFFAPPLPISIAKSVSDEVILPEELIDFANHRDVPVIIDMASDIPPKANLTRFLDKGADLVAVSGGKGIGGPQSTGILAGRKDLIEAARLNAYPNNGIGRGMKVGKEEVMGLITALEDFVQSDYANEIKKWNDRAKWLATELNQIVGVSAKYSLNTMGYADVELSWNHDLIPLSEAELKTKLRQLNPKVEYLITLRTRLLSETETQLLAQTLTRFFKKYEPKKR